MSATLAAIGSAAALGSAIYGAASSAINNNKARKLIQKQRDDNRRWYEINRAADYTSRADVQAAITKQRELLDEQMRNANATKAVTGASDESTALQKESANKATAEAAREIAAQSTAYKDNVERQYRAEDAALNQQQAQSYQQQAAETAKAASQAVNAGINVAGIGAGEVKTTAGSEVAQTEKPAEAAAAPAVAPAEATTPRDQLSISTPLPKGPAINGAAQVQHAKVMGGTFKGVDPVSAEAIAATQAQAEVLNPKTIVPKIKKSNA